MWDGGNDQGRPEWQQGMLERQREIYASNMDITGPNQGDPPRLVIIYIYIPHINQIYPLTLLTNVNCRIYECLSTIPSLGVNKVLRHGNVELVIPQKILNLRTRGVRAGQEKVSATSR